MKVGKADITAWADRGLRADPATWGKAAKVIQTPGTKI